MAKTKAKKLSDAIYCDLNRLNKGYQKQGDYLGLEFWVMSSWVKTWFYQYLVKGNKYQQQKDWKLSCFCSFDQN